MKFKMWKLSNEKLVGYFTTLWGVSYLLLGSTNLVNELLGGVILIPISNLLFILIGLVLIVIGYKVLKEMYLSDLIEKLSKKRLLGYFITLYGISQLISAIAILDYNLKFIYPIELHREYLFLISSSIIIASITFLLGIMLIIIGYKIIKQKV